METKSGDQKKVRWGRIVPLVVFSHPNLDNKIRLLLVMMSYKKANGECSLSDRKLCQLMGLADKNGEPSDVHLKSLRFARQNLAKCGFIKFGEAERKKGESKQQVWKIVPHACSEASLVALNELSSGGVVYVDAHTGEKPKGIHMATEPVELGDYSIDLGI